MADEELRAPQRRIVGSTPFVWLGVCFVTIAFVTARALYWWRYLQPGTLGRAPGVHQATFTLNLALLGLTFLLFVAR